MFRISGEKFNTLLKQVRHPDKIINDLGMRVGYLLKLKHLPFLPSSLEVEPINSCNFRCPHCQVTHWDKEALKLKIDRFEAILKQLPKLIWVKLQGMGEPLLNRELIPMLELGESKNIKMSLTTNGSLLSGKAAHSLADLTNTSINVSIDGASAQTFEQIRVGGKFDVVCKNIKEFMNLVDHKNKSNINAWMVLTKRNFHEADDVVKLVKELGLKSLTLQIFINDWGKDDLSEYADSISLVSDESFSKQLNQVLSQVKETAAKEDVDLRVFDGDFYTESNICSWPWKSSYICSNGDVVPCCMLADSDTVKMGNVFEEDFKDIWNSEKYQDFRVRHIKHDLPSYCQHCYTDVS
ncbi:Putative mycofactocin radical SAM maturase MftC [Acaryochloris thomasi RCC1774]|uniref:Mycofactocin radical SAM maturase MftC n=1 Tax=Acaryochloris thomasi RCC1774 TaxID=1764569 RepID=A0A2W1JP24_9CYAN|nr:radical SAM protein [Acaryochloris thomasi]PZD71904.1 Putative mycofactocin radical SAM maturase MftC [Acaryochloris thomasi RCC1774]